jgi:hypothetical protein
MMMHQENLCGACLEISGIDHFYDWNFQLTNWNYSAPHGLPFIAMVFDRCTDPICKYNFLDFDIYHEKQPVAYGNPSHIVWKFIPCPVLANDYIEYLLCTAITCKHDDKLNNTMSNIINYSHYFFTLAFRNMRIPIYQVVVHYDNNSYILKKNNAWVWDYDIYDFTKGINMTFIDVENKKFNDFILISDGILKPNYHGGIYFRSNLQN